MNTEQFQYDYQAKQKTSRFVGFRRGPMWTPELPVQYGIEKGDLILPLWAFEGFFYLYTTYPYNSKYFAVFKQGDWFDGRENGEGKAASGTAELLNEIVAPNPEDAVLLLRLENNQGWQTYYGNHKHIEAWMELHTETTTHYTSDKLLDIAQPERLRLDDEKIDRSIRAVIAQKNRLIMWLNNKKLI